METALAAITTPDAAPTDGTIVGGTGALELLLFGIAVVLTLVVAGVFAFVLARSSRTDAGAGMGTGAGTGTGMDKDKDEGTDTEDDGRPGAAADRIRRGAHQSEEPAGGPVRALESATDPDPDEHRSTGRARRVRAPDTDTTP